MSRSLPILVDERGNPLRTAGVTLGGYSAAGADGRGMRTWYTFGRSADSDHSPALRDLRAKSRDLVRNNPIAHGAIATIVERTVGTGLAMHARPNARVLGWKSEQQAEDWKLATEAEFELWAASRMCDAAQRLNFFELQELIVRGAMESGDCFTALPRIRSQGWPYTLRLQILESDRVGNPRGAPDTIDRTQGVVYDDVTGKPKQFFVYDHHPGALVVFGGDRYAGKWVNAWTARGTPAILHHLRVMRPGQSRGVPHLAAVIEPLKQIGRYTDAEIMAAVVSGMFTVFVKSEQPENNPLFAGGEPQTVGSHDTLSSEFRLENGAIVGLNPGEDISIANPGRPSTAFDPFVTAILRQIGMGLEIPFEILVKHYTASYSAARAALLDAWTFFRGRRMWLRNTFCQPVYELFLEEAIALGRIEAPGFFEDPLMRAAYCRADWTGDSPGSINPKDETDAWIAAVDAGIATRERAEMELFGTDWTATYDQKVRERRMMEEGGLLPEAPEPGAAGAQGGEDDAAPGAKPGAKPEPDDEDDETVPDES